MSRHLLSIMLALLSMAGLVLHPAEAGSPDRPHIVVIMADDLGFKDVGFHGSEIATPALDGLAAAGTRLEHFYVQPVCSPTRAAFMTGRYPMRMGLQVGVIRPWADYGLPLDERLLPQALKEVGYRTAITGKWHLGCHEPAYLPRNRGFDHQYGHYLGALDYFTHQRDGGLDWHRDGRALREEGYSTRLIGREAAKLIREHDLSRPLFLYVPFNAPHGPLQAPKSYIDRYAHIQNRKRRVYAAMVTCMDDEVARIIEALNDRGMRGNTLIFFCSDNGGPTRHGANNGLLRGGKGTLYEGGLRVPAIVSWPDRVKAGGVVNAALHIVDLYPTLLKLTGASLEQRLPLDGVDAWPAITEGRPSPHEEILHQQEPLRSAIRRGKWKLIVQREADRPDADWRSDARMELFDIERDPYEQRNLVRAHPEMVGVLQARIEAYADQAVPPFNGPKGQRRPADFKVPAVWGETE